MGWKQGNYIVFAEIFNMFVWPEVKIVLIKGWAYYKTCLVLQSRLLKLIAIFVTCVVKYKIMRSHGTQKCNF